MKFFKKTRVATSTLESAVASRGYVLNGGKTEIAPSFVGRGALVSSERLWSAHQQAAFGCKILPRARYLGARMHTNLKFDNEVGLRVESAR